MSEFTLDTSGAVDHVMVAGCVETGLTFEWSDLDPFTQGCINGMKQLDVLLIRYVRTPLGDGRRAQGVDWGFSNLASETLARIVADCAKWRKEWSPSGTLTEREQGETLWSGRQKGNLASIGFPPLTVFLADDGKVHLRKTTQEATR